MNHPTATAVARAVPAVPPLFALLACVPIAHAQLPQPLQERRAADGVRAGELPPSGAFGDVHGRVGTTATATLTIAVRYGYVQLHLCE